jgi:hypothetical protein
VFKINGHDPQVVRDRVSFRAFAPIFPKENSILQANKPAHQHELSIFSNRKRTTWYDCAQPKKLVKQCC